MRFIIEGNGGCTAVRGRRNKMNGGDVISTPTWNFHDHGKVCSGSMIWLDGLFEIKQITKKKYLFV
jgi:gentisate 1,2-dioxygenase